MAANWPLRSQASLVQQFVGKSLHEIPLPAAVLDIAKVKRNCSNMLKAVDEFGLDFLPEISSHRTTEITRLQLGHNAEEVRLLVTSLWEAGKLIPLLLDYQIRGIQVNILYGIPLSPSQVESAADISRQLGRRGGNIRFLVDHISQITLVERVGEMSGYPPRIYILVDVNDSFSGVRLGTPEFQELFSRIEQIVLGQGSQSLEFVGFFSDIVFPDEPPDLISHLRLFDRQLTTLLNGSPIETIRLTVRAPPGLSRSLSMMEGSVGRELLKIKQTLLAAGEANDAIEVHSGQYVLLDLRSLVQEMQTNSERGNTSIYDDIAFTILTEISSLYPRRGENGGTEALVSVGGAAFYKRDVAEYRGMVSSWNMPPGIDSVPSASTSWEIDRCRDHSAILVTKDDSGQTPALEVGHRLRIYPYDAKMAGEMFGWYYVVDSTRMEREDEIVDIFVRWRG